MRLNQEKVRRMVGRGFGSGSGAGSGVSQSDLEGFATQPWVEQNYISKEFFNTLFTIHGHDADDQAVPPTDVIIEPNDTETVLDSIEAMVGLWTEKYLSALGLSSGGGGGGDVLAEPLVSINGIGTPTAANRTLVWNGTQWTFQPYGQGGGSVTSIRITVPTGFNVSPSTAITTAGTFAITFASGYSLPSTADQANWNTAYTWVNANGASTVSKTAWGRTYWNAGAPANISGDMTSVGNISFSASGKNIGGVAYFDTTNSRLGIGAAPGAYKLDVNGTVHLSDNLYINSTKKIVCMVNNTSKTLLDFDGTQVTLGYGFNGSNATNIYGQNINMYYGTSLKVQVTTDGLKIGGATLSWDSNANALKIDTGFYSETFISALGANSSSGGGDVLAEPLVSINGIGSPTAANQTLVWNGTQWTFQPYGQGGGSVTSIRITVPTGFAVTPSTITTAGTFAITFASGYSLPTNAKQTNWDNAYTWVNTNGATVLSNSHTHSNKTVLDGISSTKVSNWDTAYSKANTLEGYFDGSGNAKSALKLTTVSKTAWGRTYWTSGGVPDSIDGDMTSVGNISFSASGKNIGGVAYFDTTNSRLGIGTTSPSTSLHVVGRVTCEYDSTKKGSFSNVRGEYLTNYGINSSGFTIITTGQSSSSSSTVRISMTPYNAPEQYILFGASSSIKMGTTISNNTETYRDGTYIQIGGARIVWDSTNNALKVIKSDGTSAANFYATGAVSALGANSDSGGGVGDVTWSALASSSDTRQIAASHLDVLSNYVTLATAQAISGSKIFTSNLKMAADIHPDTTNQCTVGTSSYRFMGCYFRDGDLSGNLTVGGRISINGTNSSYRLYVNGASCVSRLVVDNTHYFAINWNNNEYYEVGTYQNTNTEIRTYGMWYGSWRGASDIRLKNVVEHLNVSIEQIAKMPVFNFTWKEGKQGTYLGTSAQEIQKIFPAAVSKMKDGYLAMDYGATALAAAVLTARKVVNHEERIRQLERENEELRKQLNLE